MSFQHTATRRWLRVLYPAIGTNPCCFNTQPPEGGCRRIRLLLFGSLMFQHTATRRWLQEQGSEISALNKVSTHSHPKVAAANLRSVILLSIMFQHTATRRWLRLANYANCFCQSFQHTATRRWLPNISKLFITLLTSFNTQPPEGGCALAVPMI